MTTNNHTHNVRTDYFARHHPTKKRYRNSSWFQCLLIAPLVLLTRWLIKLDRWHPYHHYDMSIRRWQSNGTRVFRMYAYILDIWILCAIGYAALRLYMWLY